MSCGRRGDRHRRHRLLPAPELAARSPPVTAAGGGTPEGTRGGSAAPACDCPDPTRPEPPRLDRSRLASLIASFLFCPCHLPLTLWALGAILSGSALAFVTGHALGVAAGTTLLWAAGTAYGFWQLQRARRLRSGTRVVLVALALAGLPSGLRAQS